MSVPDAPTPASDQLAQANDPNQPTASETTPVEEMKPKKKEDEDDEEFVPEEEEVNGNDESEEEEEYKEESASEQGSLYGEEEEVVKAAPTRAAAPRASAAAAAAAVALASSAAVAVDSAPRRKGGRPRKDPHDPKWLRSDDEDDKPIKVTPVSRPANVKAPPPTFGPNTRIVRRARFRTTTTEGPYKPKGRPRKNPNDPKWAAIDEARAKAEMLAQPRGFLTSRRLGVEGEVDDSQFEGEEGELGRDESEAGPSSFFEGEADVGTPNSTRKGRPPGSKDKKPRALGTKRGRPKGSKNKPKTESPAPVSYYDDDSGSEFGVDEPKLKKRKGPSTDPSSPNYVPPVPNKWTRNPLASRQSTRKAALAKYEGEDDPMHDDEGYEAAPGDAPAAAEATSEVEEPAVAA